MIHFKGSAKMDGQVFSDSNLLPASDHPIPPTKVQLTEEVFRGRHQQVHILRSDLFHLLWWWRRRAILPLLVLNLGSLCRAQIGISFFDRKSWWAYPLICWGFPICPYSFYEGLGSRQDHTPSASKRRPPYFLGRGVAPTIIS